MQDLDDLRKHWKVLSDVMDDAWDRLTDAQTVVVARQSAAAAGAGTGPTAEECEEAAQAFDAFSRIKREMDMFMKKAFSK